MKMTRPGIVLLLASFGLITRVTGHSYNLGACPQFIPMPEFDWEKVKICRIIRFISLKSIPLFLHLSFPMGPILMLTTWHADSVLKVLTKLKNIYSFVGEQVMRGGDWMYLTRGGYWTSGGE